MPVRRVRSAYNLPLTSLVGEPIADLELAERLGDIGGEGGGPLGGGGRAKRRGPPPQPRGGGRGPMRVGARSESPGPPAAARRGAPSHGSARPLSESEPVASWRRRVRGARARPAAPRPRAAGSSRR